MNEHEGRKLLIDCLMRAVRSVHPENCLEPALPPAPAKGKIILLAGGKAAGAMMKIAARHYLRLVDKDRISGVAVGNADGFAPLFHMQWIEAGHPVPDENSILGAEQVLQLARSAGGDDLVVVLLSGGASALWSAPVAGVTLHDKRDITRQLLHSGADIIEINTVRKHLSRIKGGRLAQAAAPARIVTLIISDVVGDDPSFIASGPTAGDLATLADARTILAEYSINVAGPINAALGDPLNETLSPQDPLFENADTQIIANGAMALAAGEDELARCGYRVINLGDKIIGEARDVAERHAKMANEMREKNQSVALLSGGELTVTIRGGGVGGPSQEYALALVDAFAGTPDGLDGIYAIAADTDGCDGGTGLSNDPAGALITPSTGTRAEVKKLNTATFLQHNDSGTFFKKLDDLLITGPTHTNVNDFRLILINNNQM